MPSAADFRRAFKLSKREELGGAHALTIVSSSVGHEVKAQNERYEFPTQLTLECQSRKAAGGNQLQQRKKQVEQAFKKQTSKSKIVYSAYGSPYNCSFGLPKAMPMDDEGSRWQLTALGVAVRRRDIPTLAQQKAAEREGQEAGNEEVVSPEDKAAFLQGYRVIKSRWGTSKCSLCHQTIDPGVRIAKEDSSSSKGGWMHENCAVQCAKQAAGEGGSTATGSEQKVTGRSREGKAGGKGSSTSVRAASAGERKRRKAEAASKAAGKAGTKAKRRRRSEE